MTLSADELLAGSSLSVEVAVPAAVLHPGDGAARDEGGPAARGAGSVRLRPLTVSDLQVIARAAKESDTLMATLMVQRALIEPALSVAQVAGLHAGLVQFLLLRVNEISGLNASAGELEAAAAEPLVKATFALSRAFGWTPQQVQELTLGQVLLHLQMLGQRSRA